MCIVQIHHPISMSKYFLQQIVASDSSIKRRKKLSLRKACYVFYSITEYMHFKLFFLPCILIPFICLRNMALTCKSVLMQKFHFSSQIMELKLDCNLEIGAHV